MPTAPHPGAFGVQRKHHVHEGVDLYVPDGTAVRAVEDGEVVAVEVFTGPDANPPSPWWRETEALLVSGASGVVVYGEIQPAALVTAGVRVARGEVIGYVRQVLRKDKGRPLSMLHLELHEHGMRSTEEWIQERPAGLLDPTQHLERAYAWPYGPTSFHEDCCVLRSGSSYCDCKASAADDEDHGRGI